MSIRLRPHPLALLLTLALCLPLAARADEAPHRAKAAQLVALLHTERMVQQVSDSIMKQLSDAAESSLGPNPTSENKARLDDFEKKIAQLVDAQLGWKAMQPAFVDIYVKTFTEQQLDAIVAFYRTPAGVALLSTMPSIDAQATQLAKSRMDALQPKLNQLFDDFRKSQAAPAPATTPAPAAPAPAASKPAAPAPAASKPSASSPK